MNGKDQGPNLSEFTPSWMDDGQGIYGAEGEPSFDNNQQWDTNAWSRLNEDGGGSGGGTCTPGAPPASGTHVWGSVGGVCQWIDTTTCS